MGWIAEVLSSQFLWGIIIGVLLSTLTAFLSLKLQRNHYRKNVALLCSDLINNISGYTIALDDHRERSRLVQGDFLNLIDVEIAVWGRNREHLVLLDDEDVRRNVREFFTESSSLIAKIRFQLSKFDEFYQLSTQPGDASAGQKFLNLANQHLEEAHRLCAKLVGHVRGHSDLPMKLARHI